MTVYDDSMVYTSPNFYTVNLQFVSLLNTGNTLEKNNYTSSVLTLVPIKNLFIFLYLHY